MPTPHDMLVKLYGLKADPVLEQALAEKGIHIHRVLAPDFQKTLRFVQEQFSEGWVGECTYALSNHPVTCYIAVKDKKVIGFACYDATAKGYFGPTGVLESQRGHGIGTALLLRCLLSMREENYGYAIIGWVDSAQGFYEKTVGATVIENSFPGVYSNMAGYEPDESGR